MAKKNIKPKMIDFSNPDEAADQEKELYSTLHSCLIILREWQQLPSNKENRKRNTELYSEIKKLARKIYTTLTGEANRIKVSSAKGKARWIQEWTARKISELTGIDWGKDKLIASRPMGQAGVDVILIDSAAKAFPFSIECKSGKSSSWMDAVRQAKNNQKKNQDWLVVYKHPDFKVPVVMMDGNTFFEIYDEAFFVGEEND